jgi:Flp pilus assembly protein TadD
MSRAMRGVGFAVGFALIELGRLDEAEKKFRQCLDLDKGDKKAIAELNYLQNLREKKGGR